MKQLLALIAVLTILFTSSLKAFPIENNTAAGNNNYTKNFRIIDVIKIEYITIDGQWYMYTYYSDGSLEIQPINHPPTD